MTNNPYIRMNLTATKNGVIDPQVEVDGCLDDLERYERDDDKDAPFMLLAAHLRMKRMDPKYWPADFNPDRRFDDQFLKACLETLNEWLLYDWCFDLECLDESYELNLNPAEFTDSDRAEMAEAIIRKLDNVELVGMAGDLKRVTPDAAYATISDQINEWRQAVMDNSVDFLAAACFIQALAATIRPDLDNWNYDLAVTAIKFDVLLDTFEDAEAELAMPAFTANDRKTILALMAQFNKERTDRDQQHPGPKECV